MTPSSESKSTAAPAGTPAADHGLIGNMQTTALVSKHGAIDFMCFPRIDSPTLFGALLDEKRGGAFSIGPAGDITEARQMYLPETNVLITRFMSAQAVCEVIDFMPVPPSETRAGPDGEPAEEEGEGRNCVIRIVRGIYGKMPLVMSCAPRFNYARIGHEATLSDPNTVRFAPADRGLAITLSASIELRVEGQDAWASFEAKEKESIHFVLGEQADREQDAREIETAFKQTIAFWRAWSARATYRGRYREVVMRSALLLKLLSSRIHGAIVAAPTFGLPETPDGRRRWDYRYVWIRDAAFSVYALLRLGYTREARDFIRWIAHRNEGCEPDGSLRVMYAVDGEEAPAETEIDTLYGSGLAPPLAGNGARKQLQLDTYGALLDAIYLYNKYGEAISHDGWQDTVRTVNYVVAHWEEADHGIWEFRNRRRPLLHSRLMCWVTLDRALRLAQKRSLKAPFAEWFEVRDRIRDDIHSQFWNEELQSFVQTPDSRSLDASVLMMPLVRFIGPKDPRWLSTLDAIGRDLCVDPLVFRYTRGDSLDGLPGEEGGFSACSFWYAEALARADRVDEGRLIFERMLAYANHVGLFSEEVAISGESLGNFPQALSHLALISAAFQLDRSLDGVHADWS
jgi:GH15 family glucan-1,4-alpha-glucosidase